MTRDVYFPEVCVCTYSCVRRSSSVGDYNYVLSLSATMRCSYLVGDGKMFTYGLWATTTRRSSCGSFLVVAAMSSLMFVDVR